MIEMIRKRAVTNELDYNFLMDCLSDYKKPRDKISRLIRAGHIIRVKKGLYVFGPKYSIGPYCKETLANLIYGPSYISLEYALAFYGLIPERIEVVTSITNKRNKLFKTPVGIFSYKYIPLQKYSLGVTQLQLDEVHKIIIATKEKALADKVAQIPSINTSDDMIKYLTEDLRIDESQLFSLNLRKLKAIANRYQQVNVTVLYEVIKGVR